MASEAFWAAFSDNGGLVRDCICGRTVFASGHDGGWEIGEQEELLRKATEKPDKYIPIAEDGVSQNSIGIVWGCPCGSADRHEAFLNNHRTEIMDYYRRVINAETPESAARSPPAGIGQRDKAQCLKSSSPSKTRELASFPRQSRG